MFQRPSAFLLFCGALPFLLARAQKPCSNFLFYRSLNTKLKCGIFKTLMFVDPIECQKKCVAVWSCFSINAYHSDNGTEMCDLILGSKKSFDTPDCLVREKGSEHNVLDSSSPCSFATGSCEGRQIRKALPGFWYQLDSSAYKIFEQKKNYAEANAVCSANGGALATINSETENRFVAELFLAEKAAKRERIIRESLKPFKHWKLDGSDPDVTLHGEVVPKKDKLDISAALHFPGTDGSYATTPAWDISTMTFSISIWLKMDFIPTSTYHFYSYWSDPFLFALQFYSGRLGFVGRQIDNTLFYLSKGNVIENEWTHVVAVWDRATKHATLYQDGAMITSITKQSKTEVDLAAPIRQVFDLGYKRDSAGRGVIKGWLRELFVFDRAVTSEEVNNIKDATAPIDPWFWIGAPQEYLNMAPDIQSQTDCFYMQVWGRYQWMKASCKNSNEFICKKPV